MSLYPLTLLYDADCPVCSLEMDNLRARDAEGRLVFVDIAAPGFDAGRHGFLDGVLNDGLVDQRQHFLRHGLGGRKEPGAKARRREHRRSDPVLHALPPSRGAVTLAHAIGWEARRAHVQ